MPKKSQLSVRPKIYVRVQEHQRRDQEGGGGERTAEKGQCEAVGGREPWWNLYMSRVCPKPLRATVSPWSSAKSPETRASLETPLSLYHPHLVSSSTNTLCDHNSPRPALPGLTVQSGRQTHDSEDAGGSGLGMGVPGHTQANLRVPEGFLEEELLGRQ